MPRYFFDINDNGFQHRDDVGSDLPNAGDARSEGISVLTSLARDELPDGDHHIFTVAIRDAAGKEMYRAELVLNGRWLTGG